ncbi:hypothetical protein CDAR_442751 [Caerostris darwini]|uniref:Uncharacterized protein n=1 Tax=Caerostris darwini TaxID=1538125 RepID=A0AAV4VMZ5_9ARAC|nr:hypothetical protein CDAR_442751 [Caerostris darwini]
MKRDGIESDAARTFCFNDEQERRLLKGRRESLIPIAEGKVVCGWMQCVVSHKPLRVIKPDIRTKPFHPTPPLSSTLPKNEGAAARKIIFPQKKKSPD